MTEQREYLPETPFRADGLYSVSVDDGWGVVVNSECCSERMGRETAAKLRDALTAWLAAGGAASVDELETPT